MCAWRIRMAQEKQLHVRQYAEKKELLIVRPVKKYHIVGTCKSLNECVRMLDACTHDYVIESERSEKMNVDAHNLTGSHAHAPTASHARFGNVLAF